MTDRLQEFGHNFQIKSIVCLMTKPNFIEQIIDILISGASDNYKKVKSEKDRESKEKIKKMDVLAKVGIEQSKIDATLLGAQQQYAMQEYDIAMGQYSADASAWSGLSGGPTLTPGASAMTVRPMKQRAPRKPSAMGAILGGITTGIGVYGNTDYSGRKFGSWPGSDSTPKKSPKPQPQRPFRYLSESIA